MTYEITLTQLPSSISLSFVVISLYADEEFAATVSSIERAFSTAQEVYLRMARIIEVVSSENVDPALSARPSLLETVRIIGQDSSLYDAMNIGVRASSQMGSTHVVFLNSGALFNHLLSLPHLFETLAANSSSIILFTAEEVVCVGNHPSRLNTIRPGVLKKGALPFYMPACHQAMVYPIHALIHHPFLASKNLLAADYINFLSLIGSGFSSVTSPLLFCRYYNNGLSANNFELSIRQRCLAFALLSGRPLHALLNYICSLLKHLLAKCVSIR